MVKVNSCCYRFEPSFKSQRSYIYNPNHIWHIHLLSPTRIFKKIIGCYQTLIPAQKAQSWISHLNHLYRPKGVRFINHLGKATHVLVKLTVKVSSCFYKIKLFLKFLRPYIYITQLTCIFTFYHRQGILKI